MRIYAISGLGADERVFQYLTLDCELIPIKWKNPKQNETIEEYAARMTQEIDTSHPFGLLGVSFGGLVAVEMSKLLSPKFTILLSSAEVTEELRPIYGWFGRTGIAKMIPASFFNPPKPFSSWLFGAENKTLLHQILADTDLKFTKWAVNQLLTWKNEERLSNPMLKLSGNKDKLIPIRNATYQIIDGGEHFMVVDRAEEVSVKINEFLKKLV